MQHDRGFDRAAMDAVLDLIGREARAPLKSILTRKRRR
jgi:hypothetical protein